MGAISVMPIMGDSPKYSQQYSTNLPPALTDENGNPLPLTYGDPIYSVGSRDNPSQIIGRVGMIPVRTGSARDGFTTTFQDDPAYPKSQSLTNLQKGVAAGNIQETGLYTPATTSHSDAFNPQGKASAYSSYDPATNAVTYYDPAGNVTQVGQQTHAGIGFMGDLMNQIGTGLAKNDLTPLTLGLMAGAGGAGLMADTGGFAGLNPGIDLGAATPAAGTSLSNLAAMDGGSALTAAVGGGGAAPALTPAALESLTGQAGYGVNAAAQAAAPSLGVNPAIVGSGSLVGAPSMNAAQTLIGGPTNVMSSVVSPTSPITPAAPVAPPATAYPVSTPSVNGYSLGDIAAATPVETAVPAAGMSANEAIASGMGPGSAGAQMAATGGLNAEQLAAAAGTTGAGSALNGLATTGNASSLTDLLNQGSSGIGNLLSQAGNAIGNTVNGLSGTQLAALGTGAAGLYNASATREAMQQAIGAQQAATAASQGTLGNIYNQQLGYQAPYQTAGVGAVNQLAGMTPYLTHQFNAADLQAGLAPNYDFMLQQGQQANQRAANVGGGALGGNALTGLNRYTQDYAGNAYQNAFNNYQNQRTNIYNNLAGIANIGQTANVGAGTAGTNYGQGTVGLNTSLANAQAANILGQAQVGAGGVTNAANTAFLATLLGQNTPTAGTTPTSGGTSISDFAKLLTGIKGLMG